MTESFSSQMSLFSHKQWSHGLTLPWVLVSINRQSCVSSRFYISERTFEEKKNHLAFNNQLQQMISKLYTELVYKITEPKWKQYIHES